MARIPDGDIERMKAEVSLVRLVEASGVALEKRGADHVGRCPFHDDKTPSLVITPAKNLWRCFGACDAGGDAIAWASGPSRGWPPTATRCAPAWLSVATLARCSSVTTAGGWRRAG